MTNSLNNTAQKQNFGSNKNVPNKNMKMGNKVILKPLETQDDYSKANDLLAVVGKKPNSQCQMVNSIKSKFFRKDKISKVILMTKVLWDYKYKIKICQKRT